MTVNDVRARYLAFFKKQGHVIVPSAPLVPQNDPTTLFTGSGMQPMVPFLLGEEHPEGTRIADSQKCFRSVDIEEVGDNRHTTLFEMLGNWSLGDYFKQEQLRWCFEFLVNEIGLDPHKLYVTTFIGDEANNLPRDTESVEIWQTLFKEKGIDAGVALLGAEEEGGKRGIKEGEHIFSYDARKNWWSRAGVPENMPAGEPGGPDSEVFYDFGLPHDTKFGAHCHPNCDCGRFLEICNSVFMEYLKNSDGSFGKLPKRNVDFGGGLERISMAAANTPDIIAVNHRPVLDYLEKVSGKKYAANPEETKSFRIIADHMKAATFLITDGVLPAKSDQGYFVRRLIRRSVREADRLGIKDSGLAAVVKPIAEMYADVYPELTAGLANTERVIAEEEAQFRRTLSAGEKELEKTLRIFVSEDLRVTDSILMQVQDAVTTMQREIQKHLPAIQKMQREVTEASKQLEPITRLIREQKLNGDSLYGLYTTYGFPPELSLEEIERLRTQVNLPKLSPERVVKIMTEYNEEMKAHQEESRAGAAQKFAGGLADHAEQTIKYHTAHHILLKALQMVLGPDVHQRGSNITSERLRIDFSFGRKVTPEELAKVEQIVNAKIAEALPVVRTVMPKEEAEKLGAEHEFGATYPDQVSVYSVGPLDSAFSIEFCGGPHVENTRELGEGGKHFKILKEEASSAGVRRIKAVLQ